MRKLIILLSVIFIAFSCEQPDRPKIPALIPIPNILEETSDVFQITPDTRIVVNTEDKEQMKIADYLVRRIEEVTGSQLLITGKGSKNCISLEAPTNAKLGHLVTPAPEPGLAGNPTIYLGTYHLNTAENALYKHPL